MRRVALRLPEWAWTGGVNYVESVCRALLAYPEFGYEPWVFCSPQIDAQLRRRLEELLGKRLVTHPDLARAARRARQRAGARQPGHERAAPAVAM
jgi:hypothetical protein